ncbi:hypothetical protein RvY_02854 [Ramazzottius varieornatus]|uniref:Uncharacterized protein n=1 Tax=Ramazzottius varieornatus TaxID=947166 RepID=A0A1D1UL39_RAMVA|nr:hypothetical protein RvY_02854 [Ramazzottius varieornatus]
MRPSQTLVSGLSVCVLSLCTLKFADSKVFNIHKVDDTVLHYPHFTGKLQIPDGKTLAIQCSSITAITILGAKFAKSTTVVETTTSNTYLRYPQTSNATCPESNMMNYVTSVCGRERTSSCAIKAIDPLP